MTRGPQSGSRFRDASEGAAAMKSMKLASALFAKTRPLTTTWYERLRKAPSIMSLQSVVCQSSFVGTCSALPPAPDEPPAAAAAAFCRRIHVAYMP